MKPQRHGENMQFPHTCQELNPKPWWCEENMLTNWITVKSELLFKNVAALKLVITDILSRESRV